jgi:hypothetical protein
MKDKYASQKRWYKENKEKADKYRADWARKDRLENSDFYKAREFAREMKKYGTTVEWYRDLLIKQLGLCAICGHLSHHHGTIQRLQVDHNHACCDLHTKSCGKCLRGLLCADCNIRLAPVELLLSEFVNYENAEVYLRNSVTPGSWTHRALQYLKKYAETPGVNDVAEGHLRMALAMPRQGVRLTNVQVPTG